jgi:hypothetical protein
MPVIELEGCATEYMIQPRSLKMRLAGKFLKIAHGANPSFRTVWAVTFSDASTIRHNFYDPSGSHLT